MITDILELNNILSNNTRRKLSSTSKDFTKFLLLEAITHLNKSTLIVCNNEGEAQNLFDFFTSTDMPAHLFPALPNPYSHISPPKSLMVKRIDTLANIYLSSKSVVITSVGAIIQKTLSNKYLENNFFSIKRGDTLERESLIDFLITKGYRKVSLVAGEGEFALRGDIIDVCSYTGAVRIDFFDDSVERIRLFDILSQKSYEEIENVSIKPSTEIILNEDTIHNFKANYQKIFGMGNKEFFELLDKGILPKFIENYIPLFYMETAGILDYMKDANIFVFDGFEEGVREAINLYTEEYDYLVDSKNIFKNQENILPPSELLCEVNIEGAFHLSNLKQEDGYNFNVQPVAPQWSMYKNQEKSPLVALANFIKDNLDKQFFIFTFEDSFAESINAPNVQFINNSHITEGFIFKNKVVISQSEITGIKKTFSSSKRKSQNKILAQLSSIEIGDIVIHVKHGFGEYRGIHTLNVNGAEHDFLEIMYREGEKLFVPVENIDTLTRHSSNNENIILDKLGSSAFEKKSAKIKEKIKDIAYDLIQIAANRNIKKAATLDFNAEDYDKFLQGFPFVETEDQLNAIND
ncbi:MAG: hypothetical protein LBQ34_06820, partial [Alphaproteobacteria bacterium]|nr:hypothetical protein [Alphaproteobacteria bacterium]